MTRFFGVGWESIPQGLKPSTSEGVGRAKPEGLAYLEAGGNARAEARAGAEAGGKHGDSGYARMTTSREGGED